MCKGGLQSDSQQPPTVYDIHAVQADDGSIRFPSSPSDLTVASAAIPATAAVLQPLSCKAQTSALSSMCPSSCHRCYTAQPPRRRPAPSRAPAADILMIHCSCGSPTEDWPPDVLPHVTVVPAARCCWGRYPLQRHCGSAAPAGVHPCTML